MSPPSVLILMGVSGSGKSTIGELLADRLGWSYQDADSFHPPENIAKMSRGIPLSDEDRWPWLDAIAGWIEERLARGESGLVSCSALKRAYRDRLQLKRQGVRLVFLRGEKSLIASRLAARIDHFMPPALLDSQFAALEEPEPDERALVVPIDPDPQAIAGTIIARLGLTSSSRSGNGDGCLSSASPALPPSACRG